MKRYRTTLAAAAVVALGSVALAGCDADGYFESLCTTNPPLPRQPYIGHVTAYADAPLTVEPGETFTVTIESLGSDGASGEGAYPGGVVSMSGPVSIGGPVSVGGLLGRPFPATLTYTVTGASGDLLRLRAETGTSVLGTLGEDSYLETCEPVDGGLLRTIRVVDGDG
jgi:hypothetical protein